MQDALDEEFWRSEDDELVGLTAKMLVGAGEAAVAYHEERVGETEVTARPDWEGVSTDIAEWALEHSGHLCRATWLNRETGRYEFTPDKATINANTRRAIGARVATWFETPGATLGDLMGEIGQLRAFGPLAPEVPGRQTRAQLVATSEVTYAAGMGNKLAADAASEVLEPVGIVAYDTWHTNRDDKVCGICEPLEGVKVRHGEAWAGGIYVPIRDTHPGCYCWTTTRYEVQEEGG